MKLSIQILTISLISLVGGCVTTTPYDPFVITRSEIYERVDTIALLPLHDLQFDRRDEVSARYEALITEQLEKAGFQVIPSREYADIREGLTDQVGDLYDPQTGEANKENLDAVRTNSLLRLAEQFNPQAYILPRIVSVGAHWFGKKAQWHGVRRRISGPPIVEVEDKIKGFWEFLLATPEDPYESSGTIPAISLSVNLSSMSGETYYVDRGGIQLTTYYKDYAFEDVPESEWFVIEEMDEIAVAIALAALVNEPQSEP